MREMQNTRIIYYQCRFTQLSPLRIGTGEGEETDSDVMKDRRGLPFLPGSGIAGVLRDYLPEDTAKRLFGCIDPDPEKPDTAKEKTSARKRNVQRIESRILVSDATLPAGLSKDAFRIVNRDGVGLNDRGTAKNRAKYDFEVVECGKPYTAVLEISETAAEADIAALETVLRDFIRNGVSFGARTTRGYGRMRVEIRKREFTFPADLDTWLKFDPMDAEAFDGDPKTELLKAGAGISSDVIHIEAQLHMNGSFSVRQPLAKPPEQAEGDTERSQTITVRTFPDDGPIYNMEKCPVIPGTAWAGSFRHYMRNLIAASVPDVETRESLLTDLDTMFGVVGEKQKRRSDIRFAETVVKGSHSYTVTRIAVDRFTNAPRNQGLFTTEVAADGNGVLQIELAAAHLPGENKTALLRLLAAALNDLHLGLLTAGGQGSVGRGICEITAIKVNGADVTEAVRICNTDYLVKAAENAKGGG